MAEFKYHAMSRMPNVWARLERDGVTTTAQFGFIVDSGARESIAPRAWASEFTWLDELPEAPTGLKDANGGDIRGVRQDVIVHIGGLDPFTEPVIFSRSARFGLLGQTAFFERFEIKFANFSKAKNGRRFFVWRPSPRLV